LVITLDQAQNKHKKFARKEVPLAQGLREFKESFSKSGLGFDSWAKEEWKEGKGETDKLLTG
jgi:hypothetical protein